MLHHHEHVNKGRQASKEYQVNDLVFAIKYTQSKGKLDPGMRGTYKVTRVLKNGRYEVRLVAGAYGKLTYAGSQFMVPWKGEWTPDECAAFFASADQHDESIPSTSADDLVGIRKFQQLVPEYQQPRRKSCTITA